MYHHQTNKIFRNLLVFTLSIFGIIASVHADDTKRIQPNSANPYYWQYEGNPILLLGGSKEDNLFNHPDGLAEHLDTLVASGGNYIRNTMSSRNPGNPWAFKQQDNGLYDLNEWNPEYWQRLDNLLSLCQERGIIVQIEIWDPWDYFKTEAPLGYGPDNVGWESCPFNPMLNINYTAEESGLAEEIDYYSGARPSDHIFFHTPPALKDVPLVRQYQEAFVKKLLSVSLEYPNVLYCMDNEIGEPPEWGKYWANFIRDHANEAGKQVYLTDMRRNSNFESEEQVSLLHDREHYDFFEISQNNANNGQKHYDHIIHIRNQVSENPIPINNVKIYGGDIGSWTTSVEEGTQRFWRNIFGGCASSRFHRPGPSHHFFAIGLSELAQTHIKSMRTLTDAMHVFTCQPQNNLLSDRNDNEAFCLAEPGKQYAVYFPDGGNVTLDISDTEDDLTLKWMNILESEWTDEETIQASETIALTAPGDGPWAALLISKNQQTGNATKSHIQPYSKNPHYLAWDDTPVFGLGATNYHSWTPISRPENVDFKHDLARLSQVIKTIDSPHVRGFVRCLPYDPMNHIHDGEVTKVLQPWLQMDDGRYDLEQFEPAWETRLRDYLQTALDHQIIVSLEIWDDWSITRGPNGAYDPGEGAAWNAHPFNPNNNINYDDSALPTSTDSCNAPFYSTIPSAQNIEPVLKLQKHYVDKVLSIASDYPNIMINITNESRANLAWSHYWAEYIRERIAPDVMLGEMPSTNRKDGGGECEHEFSPLTLCTDQHYDYVDIAQGVSGHEFGSPREQALGGGKRIQEYYQAMQNTGTIRPLITSKDYTRDANGGDIVLWSRFVTGVAAARFHRPAGDHSETVSQFQHDAILRLGQFIDQVPFWEMKPAPEVIQTLPEGAGANVLANPDSHCVVQLIGGKKNESILLKLTPGKWIARWINLTKSNITHYIEINSNEDLITLFIPQDLEHQILYLEKQP